MEKLGRQKWSDQTKNVENSGQLMSKQKTAVLSQGEK